MNANPSLYLTNPMGYTWSHVTGTVDDPAFEPPEGDDDRPSGIRFDHNGPQPDD